MYKLDRFVGARALIEQAIKDRKIASNKGTINYEDYAQSLEVLSPFEILKELIQLQNAMADFWMPLIDMFTETPEDMSSQNVITEKYQVMKVETATLRGDTKTQDFQERSILIPVGNQEIKLRWVSRDYQKNPFDIIGTFPVEASRAFRKRHIEQFLYSILVIPSDQKANTPCLYRDTSTFPEEEQVIPFPHGLKEFTNAESHYLVSETVSSANLSALRKKVQSKGYGANGLYYIASESYWEEMMNLPTWSQNVQTMFEMQDRFFDGRGGDKYIKVPDVYMPENGAGSYYVICIDPSVKTFRKVRPDDKGQRGVIIPIREESSLEVVNELKFLEEGVGFGVQTRGSAAVMYIKTGATTYVNPNITIKG